MLFILNFAEFASAKFGKIFSAFDHSTREQHATNGDQMLLGEKFGPFNWGLMLPTLTGEARKHGMRSTSRFQLHHTPVIIL